MLYVTDLLLRDTTLSDVVIALDLLKAVVGRETEVVMLLSLSARGAWLKALASIPKGAREEAARSRRELNSMVESV